MEEPFVVESRGLIRIPIRVSYRYVEVLEVGTREGRDGSVGYRVFVIHEVDLGQVVAVCQTQNSFFRDVGIKWLGHGDAEDSEVVTAREGLDGTVMESHCIGLEHDLGKLGATVGEGDDTRLRALGVR